MSRYKYKNYIVEMKGETLISNLVIVRVMDMFAPDGRFLTVNIGDLQILEDKRIN